MRSENSSISFYKTLGPSILDDRAHGRKDDLRIVKSLCKKKHQILDLGCGVGRVTIPLALADYDIYGIDLSSTLVKEAKKRLREKNLDPQSVKKGSMLKIPYRNDSFDRIFCLWTVFNELLEKNEQILALNEMNRVLRPGGMAFLDLVNGELKSVKEMLSVHGRGWQKKVAGMKFNSIQHFCFFHDRKSLKTICQASKFDFFKIKLMNFNRQRRLIAILKNI